MLGRFQGRGKTGPTMTWAQAAEAFRRWLEVERGVSPRTLAAYGRDVDELRRFLEEKRGRAPAPREVDVVSLRAFLASLFGKNDAASMARKLSGLRAFFRFLARRGHVEGDPTALV